MIENEIFWEILRLGASVIAPSLTVWLSVKNIVARYFSKQNQKNELIENRIEIIEKRLTILELKLEEADKENTIEFNAINENLINLKKSYELNGERNEETHKLLENMNKNFLQVIELISNKKFKND
jgi:hypothetical protein